MIEEICTFNSEALNINPDGLQRLKGNDRSWLVTALKEELTEFEDSETLVDDVDALLDLCYFAIGGLYRAGLTPEQIRGSFEVIHNANMAKKIGVKENREGFDGVTDAVKPEGWVSPEQKIYELIYG